MSTRKSGARGLSDRVRGSTLRREEGGRVDLHGQILNARDLLLPADDFAAGHSLIRPIDHYGEFFDYFPARRKAMSASAVHDMSMRTGAD